MCEACVFDVRHLLGGGCSYEFGLMEPAYEAIAPVDLETLTHAYADGDAAWRSGSLAFMVSIDDLHKKEQTEAAVHMMWQTFAFAVLVNLVTPIPIAASSLYLFRMRTLELPTSASCKRSVLVAACVSVPTGRLF